MFSCRGCCGPVASQTDLRGRLGDVGYKVEFTGCRVQGRRLTDRHVARCYFVSLIGRTAKGGGFRRGQNHLFGVTIVNITVRHDLAGMSVMLGRPREGNISGQRRKCILDDTAASMQGRGSRFRMQRHCQSKYQNGTGWSKLTYPHSWTTGGTLWVSIR